MLEEETCYRACQGEQEAGSPSNLEPSEKGFSLIFASLGREIPLMSSCVEPLLRIMQQAVFTSVFYQESEQI
jgi:hypothetical protein